MKTLTKKIALSLMALALVLTFPGCEKNNTNENHSGNIVGVWTLESTTLDVLINGKSMIDYFMEEFNLTKEQAEALADLYFEGGNSEGTIEFKPDGTYMANMDGEKDEGIYEISADKKKLTIDKGTIYEMEFVVRTLTSSALIVEFTETESEDINEDGVADEIEILITMAFKR